MIKEDVVSGWVQSLLKWNNIEVQLGMKKISASKEQVQKLQHH